MRQSNSKRGVTQIRLGSVASTSLTSSTTPSTARVSAPYSLPQLVPIPRGWSEGPATPPNSWPPMRVLTLKVSGGVSSGGGTPAAANGTRTDAAPRRRGSSDERFVSTWATIGSSSLSWLGSPLRERITQLAGSRA